MENNERKAKNSEARIRANNKYKKANYQRISVDIRPEQAEIIRNTAKQFNISIAQLIINSVNEYKTNYGADTAQPEQDTTESPMESEKTAGAHPEEEAEEETENEIETEEENQTAGAEEPAEEEETHEAEDEDEKPEEMPSFVWEQIQRLKKADKRHTAERKAREAAERKRRRAEEGGEDY